VTTGSHLFVTGWTLKTIQETKKEKTTERRKETRYKERQKHRETRYLI
jgi:hypothetical protein